MSQEQGLLLGKASDSPLPPTYASTLDGSTSADATKEVITDASNGKAFGTKSISFFGGIMLLINCVAGPTISLMPGLAQEAGWLAMILAMVVIATLSVACAYMLIEAMKAIPNNRDFALRVEFNDIVKHYFNTGWYKCIMIVYHFYLTLTLMSYIIQSSQVIDYVFMDVFGCAYGLKLGPLEWVCGTDDDSATPFGDEIYVFSLAMVVTAIVCAPFSLKNLDDNIILQIIAVGGLSVLAVVWICVLTSRPEFPTSLPVATERQASLIGTLLFNFAFISTLPSWINEKKPQVSTGATFGITLSYVVLVYATIGIVGGLAFEPYWRSDKNLFSKLYHGKNQLGTASVLIYPILQNFTSIPVFSILIRYNVVQSGLLSHRWSSFVSTVLPWLLCIPFYTGKGFETVAAVGGTFTSSIVNFIVPVVLYIMTWPRRSKDKAIEPEVQC
eukprot:gnl/TRDRNA2_/TRDRNA2_189760_c0_seq1.p1 gnl/TRDRNA2_/TRDRNA2_189760_c0~~gnl/TRDRNA2_/TRDRNA2_189760_c0_seq1.p1  ORF type:complete len:443 (+),score=68.10 gnl/TRDRNA2_/TRDRNA2_189760_c0_seq1:84-1412(+)